MRQQTVFLVAVAVGLLALWTAAASLAASHLSTILAGLSVSSVLVVGMILMLVRSLHNDGGR